MPLCNDGATKSPSQLGMEMGVDAFYLQLATALNFEEAIFNEVYYRKTSQYVIVLNSSKCRSKFTSNFLLICVRHSLRFFADIANPSGTELEHLPRS
jgi:hypothetical protein